MTCPDILVRTTIDHVGNPPLGHRRCAMERHILGDLSQAVALLIRRSDAVRCDDTRPQTAG
jgi:hypothetical protein